MTDASSRASEIKNNADMLEQFNDQEALKMAEPKMR